MELLMKRPRYPSKYVVSPFTDPRAKRRKAITEPSHTINPIFIHESLEDWNELKDWIEADDSQPPYSVVLLIPDEFEVSRGFFQDLVTCNLWLATYHVDALTFILNRDNAPDNTTILSPYLVEQIMRKLSKIGLQTNF
ncbi:unnamed protein product [Cuscuta epithymum]|uniref:Uncharacterized protein n=1 Tax=Cuscuta epithymum TaxID=186058 RepID=A0AAV0GKC9_9ASTE|nr:unnamed protein product [Cuscuta epithymum]